VTGPALLTAAILLAGCGGTAPPGSNETTGGTTRPAFLARVDSVCARAVTRHAGDPFPVTDFDPEHPDPSQLPAVGDYLLGYGGVPATTKALHALRPPPGQAAA